MPWLFPESASEFHSDSISDRHSTLCGISKYIQWLLDAAARSHAFLPSAHRECSPGMPHISHIESMYLFCLWSNSAISLNCLCQGGIGILIWLPLRTQRNMSQTIFILYVFGGCFQLLSVLSHIFSYFFCARPAKLARTLLFRVLLFFQSLQETYPQKFITPIYLNYKYF